MVPSNGTPPVFSMTAIVAWSQSFHEYRGWFAGRLAAAFSRCATDRPSFRGPRFVRVSSTTFPAWILVQFYLSIWVTIASDVIVPWRHEANQVHTRTQIQARARLLFVFVYTDGVRSHARYTTYNTYRAVHTAKLIQNEGKGNSEIVKDRGEETETER